MRNWRLQRIEKSMKSFNAEAQRTQRTHRTQMKRLKERNNDFYLYFSANLCVCCTSSYAAVYMFSTFSAFKVFDLSLLTRIV